MTAIPGDLIQRQPDGSYLVYPLSGAGGYGGPLVGNYTGYTDDQGIAAAVTLAGTSGAVRLAVRGSYVLAADVVATCLIDLNGATVGGGHSITASGGGRVIDTLGVSGASVTVSPTGLAAGAAVANNGADYGPDTPGTTSQGVVEAINYAIAQALLGKTYDVLLLNGGKFTPTSFADTTYRIAYPIDAGYAASAGPPVVITIRGVGPAVTNVAEGTGFTDAYPLGGTVIDASGLDVLAQGLYAQGRVFGVVPRATSGTGFAGTHPLNAVQLQMENLTIIVPTYNAAGTGSPAYSLTGTSSKLFVNGDTQSSSTTHWQFVNGIDAWAASSFKAKNISVISAIAAYNATGNQYAGGGGVFAYGSAGGIVFPEEANQGNDYFETVSTYDLHVGMMVSTHTAGDQFYAQASQHALYMISSGHGVRLGRVLVQSANKLIQHALLPQLTTSLSGAFFDPVGDLYAGVGMTFPASASPSTLTIAELAVEASLNNLLADDAANPLTVVANVDHTGTISPSAWGSGANLMVNMTDVTGNGLTVLTGTTAGTITYSQSGVTPWDKRFVAYLNGYENTTATAQTITFVVPYNNPPAVVKNDATGATATATTLTLPASMSAPVTGYIILEGY